MRLAVFFITAVTLFSRAPSVEMGDDSSPVTSPASTTLSAWQVVCQSCHFNATCDFVPPTYEPQCKCKKGYTGNGTVCSELDPCYPNPCQNEDCKRIGGQEYECICLPGNIWSPRKKYCEDLNECEQSETLCFGGSTCVNTQGSYDCTCPTGRDYNSTSCNDIDECTVEGGNRCAVNANCENTIGSYSCTCDPGFEGDGYVCQDFDECLSINDCSTNAICNNTAGSYECICNDGFSGDGKICHEDAIQPCVPFNNVWCSRNSICGFNRQTFKLQCSCMEGFEGDGKHCTDIDECDLGIHSCQKQNKICLNRDGTHECRDINSECFDSTDAKIECQCKPGYEGNYTLCSDVNECVNGNYSCSEHATCSNTEGSYNCSCSKGYSGNGKVCNDVNECLDNTKNNCTDQGKLCLNTKGSYECRHPNTTCSYSTLQRKVICECNAGYTGSDTDCTDINECDSNPCEDSINCTNTAGSYECMCKDGFVNNFAKTQCKDVDECQISSTCPQGSTCINTRGNYTCQCKSGFRYIPRLSTCKNIDECQEGRDTCSNSAVCTDTVGSFSCRCNEGFVGDGFTCQDVNECLSTPCHPDADCSNKDGTYECTCKTGYSGDGKDNCEGGAVRCGTDTSNLYCSPDAGCGYAFPSGYYCRCKEGYQPLGADGQICRDVDECLTSDPCINSKNCTNSIGSYECVCKDGFQHADVKKRICRGMNTGFQLSYISKQ